MKHALPILVLVALFIGACVPGDPMSGFSNQDFINADNAAAAYPYPAPYPVPISGTKVISIQFISALQMQIVIEFTSSLSGTYGALVDSRRYSCQIDSGNNRRLVCIGPALSPGATVGLKVYQLAGKYPVLVFKTTIVIPGSPFPTLTRTATGTLLPYPQPPTRTPTATPGIYPPPPTATGTSTKTALPYPPPPSSTTTPTPGIYPPPVTPTTTSTVTKTSIPYPPPPSPTRTATPGPYPPPKSATPTATKTSAPVYPVPTSKPIYP